MLHAVSLTLRRPAAVVIAGAVLAISWVYAAPQQAEPQAPSAPAVAPAELDPPSITLPPEAKSRPAEGAADAPPRQRELNQIQEALRGGGSGAPSTGDPILDDVIGVIRAQGSILEGSVLEEAADPAAIGDVAAPPGDAGEAEQRYRVAESLLRAARQLSDLPHPDPQRQALVRQMRAEATRCLSQP